MNWDTLETLVSKVLKLDSRVYNEFKDCQRFIAAVPEKIENVKECVADAIVDGKFALPFKRIRMIDTQPDLDGGEHAYLIAEKNGGIVVVEFVRNVRAVRNGVDCSILLATISAEELAKRAEQPPDCPVYVGGAFMCERLGILLHADRDIVTAKSCLGLIDRVCWFVSLVNTPGHFIARVQPSKTRQQAHSVQWTEAKTHHVILERNHGKMLLAGKVRDFNGSLTRAMHWRRAHKKTLSSPRYTHKRFQQIWIKQTWVGPTEWAGTDRQIYKIINPKGERITQ